MRARIRFSIASLLFLIVGVAIGFGALRAANALWDFTIFSLTLVILATSVLLAIHRRNRARAFWLGFAIFGSTYLAASLVPSIQERLLTGRALSFLKSHWPRSGGPGTVWADFDSDGELDLFVTQGTWPNTRSVVATQDRFTDVTTVAGVAPQQSQWKAMITAWESILGGEDNAQAFVRIGHSLSCLWMGLIGGVISRWLAAVPPGRCERSDGSGRRHVSATPPAASARVAPRTS